MSGLELVAGIAGVAAAAIRVSVSMNDLAEELGSAGRDVRYIGNDMAGFSQVLRLVHSTLEEGIKTAGSSIIQSSLEALPQLVEQCTMVHEEANGLMAALKPSTGKDSSISFFQRMKFVFYKGRITILRSLLDSSKSTLNLLLVTLNIEMAKNKKPDKAWMEQLQNERKAFIRVVHSQSKALDEAMKEAEKAKKEAAKFKIKRDKEKEKEREAQKIGQEAETDDGITDLPKRNSTPYSYKPPPPYALHSTPSVSQLVYQPPSLERFNSVRKSSNAVTSLALSLEPVRSTSNDAVPMPPTSPPDGGPYGAYTRFAPSTPQSPQEGHAESSVRATSENTYPHSNGLRTDENTTTRPAQSGKRVFSDPGPGHLSATFDDFLTPDQAPRERSRSPYGFSRVPQDETPQVERKRASTQPQFGNSNPMNATQHNHRTFSTPAFGGSNTGSVAEETMPTATSPRDTTTSPGAETQKPAFTYSPPPPPPSPVYTEAPPAPAIVPTSPVSPRPTTPLPRKPSIPPPPPPRHGTTYIVLTPYLSHEVGHLSLVPFDTLVDVVAYTLEESDLPYPTIFDSQPKHYWQASLGHRRGPRGLFPCEVVCTVDDERVAQKLSESWFAEESVGFIADAQGRCWIGPRWEWKEPVRRRSKWWAEEF